MFTGLVEAVGRLDRSEARGGDRRLRIGLHAPLPGEPLSLGESIAVSGVCLTVVAFDAQDGLGTLESTAPDGRSQRWRIAAPRALLRYIAAKGSICVDGVSLTVNAADGTGFEVNLIPHTIQHTSFAHVATGQAMNLEVDLLARYAERLAAIPA